MTRTYLISLLTLATACGGEEQSTDPQPNAQTQPAPEPEPSPEPAQPAQPPAQPAPGGTSNFGTITLRTGFLPDPHIARGTSGGAIAASTLESACTGFVSQTPDHLLEAQTAFSTLRLLAHADGDVTLVVQRPDGTYVCDDDTEGSDPVVQIDSAPSGTYRIWVGSYAQGSASAYTLGVTEMSSAMPSSLP